MELEKQVHADLKRHEGCVLKAYQDTEGVWTIGYGHTRYITKDTREITQIEAEAFLLSDMFDAHMEAKQIMGSCWNTLDKVRQSVVINMVFNLGPPRFKQFKATIDHICAGQYKDAAEHMLASKWAKQVKGRAVELAERMRTGRIEEKHRIPN